MQNFLRALKRAGQQQEPFREPCQHETLVRKERLSCGRVRSIITCGRREGVPLQLTADDCNLNGCTWYEPLKESSVKKEKQLPKLTHIINTKNEGPDVLQTVLSFRAAYAGPYEAVIIDDGSEDGSCDFAKDWKGEFGITLIRNEKSVGCGKAKHMGIKSATGDVFIHSDGHCRVLRSDFNAMVARAKAEECILCPGVPPLYTPMDKQAGPKEFYKPNRNSYGGTIAFDQKHPDDPDSPKRLHVVPKWKPKEEYARRDTTWWAVFMMSRKTAFERMGGWNKYPGVWGSQEIGLALRAWFADVPIYAVRDVVVGHRYQVDTHYKAYKKELSRRGIKNYRTPLTRENHVYAHMLAFDDETIENVWKPRWLKQWGEVKWAKMMSVVAESDLKHQHGLFLKRHKRRTDAEFIARFCPELLTTSAIVPKTVTIAPKTRTVAPIPAEMIPNEDITAIILNWKRPESTQKCVDKIREYGIKNIWVWCQEKATPPKGATRVFTDSENSVTWSRYCISALAPTPWILYCDDDVHLKAAGIDGLRRGAVEYPGRVLGLIGAQFREPFTSYNKRHFFKSHTVSEAIEVDMLWPKGQLIPRDVAQRVFGDAAVWQMMRKQTGITRGDDLLLAVALQRAGEKPQLVVPSKGVGYHESKASGDQWALYKNNLRAKRKMVRRYQLEMGWKPILMPADWMAPKPEAVFEWRYKYYMDNIGVRIQQHRAEAAEFFHEMEVVKPKVFVEVGSAAGGTLYTFAGACEKGATIISVDLAKRFPERKYLKRTLARLKEEGFDVHLVKGDSHKPEQRKKLLDILHGRPVDACFVDGDHRAPGVWRDWEDYGKLVRKGGVVGFHDIKAKRMEHTSVWKAWAEIKNEGRASRDIYGGPAPVGRTTTKPIDVGIGVLWI